MLMIIGVPKEIKASEYRVALTPAGAAMLKAAGHEVVVQSGAGSGSSFADDAYARPKARLSPARPRTFGSARRMMTKVKEPLPEEFGFFRDGLLLFTYLHLAAAPESTKALLGAGVSGVAYETIQWRTAVRRARRASRRAWRDGREGPIRVPGGVDGGPATAGRRAGRLLEVIILGGGIVGTNAARIALGMGASVVILERSAERMRYIDEVFGGRIRTLMSNAYNIANAVKKADLLIGAVLIPGARAPHLVTEDMVKTMKKGAVIVDVAVDQGGTIATIDRVTTHKDPVYEKHGVLHYAVANMPGAVPRTSTLALTNVTMPYALDLAGKGLEEAVRQHEALRKGVNTYKGRITHPQVAESVGMPYVGLEQLLQLASRSKS